VCAGSQGVLARRRRSGLLVPVGAWHEERVWQPPRRDGLRRDRASNGSNAAAMRTPGGVAFTRGDACYTPAKMR